MTNSDIIQRPAKSSPRPYKLRLRLTDGREQTKSFATEGDRAREIRWLASESGKDDATILRVWEA